MSKPGAKPYKWVRAPNHPKATKKGFTQEHRLIAEQLVGRILYPEEVVHHIDGNTLNNNLDNLMIFATSGDHAAFHTGKDIYNTNSVWRAVKRENVSKSSKSKYGYPEKTCPFCKNTFFPNEKNQKFCSVECLNKNNKKLTADDYSRMQILLYKNNGNFLKTARELKISGSALVARLKRANLPYHSSDYRSG